MLNRKRGTWVNFNAPQHVGAGVTFARVQPGNISTSRAISGQPVVTNGRIGSVSDTVTMTPQTAQAAAEHDQA
jgi:hypothetical protein